MTTTEAITVMIVDDHPVVRDGLNAILSTEPDLKVAGEAGNGEEALRRIPELRPNIVLMDLMLPDMPGWDVIKAICDQGNDIDFIVLTSVAGDEDIFRALEAGARGYLFKDMARKELIQSIRSVRAGERYLPVQVGSKRQAHLREAGRQGPDPCGDDGVEAGHHSPLAPQAARDRPRGEFRPVLDVRYDVSSVEIEPQVFLPLPQKRSIG